MVSEKIRGILGGYDKASHFRIGTHAIEFNLFCNSKEELEHYTEKLTKEFSRILLVTQLDIGTEPITKQESIQTGIEYFNQERFWESNEILEIAWKESTGREKEIIQGLILTAAAFVHQQKGEDSIALSILNRAREKIGDDLDEVDHIDIARVREEIDQVLSSAKLVPFKISMLH
jgi:predicted metal-dependent hydrolase